MSRGAFSVVGLSRVFRALDDNSNCKVDMRELMEGLGSNFDIHLTQEEAIILMAAFDKDNSGAISFDEFVEAMKGDLNAARLSWVKAAYSKLDVNGDGTVTLDDIAKLYDVASLPDVQQGRPLEDAYKQFMAMWDTQTADGVVTFAEFLEYFHGVSACVESDELFAAMMKSAWKL